MKRVYIFRLMNRFTTFCLLTCLFVFCGKPQAQVTLTDSNLPIVIIAIDGNGGIPDEPKVKGNMKIIYSGEGQRNAVSETDPNKINYNGRIAIEVRGSSSQALEKKQYGLTTLQADNTSNNNVSLLGMPPENDWILSGLAFDASFMRDYMAFTLSRSIGQYASRTQYCELIINGNYRGIYMLVEKIKVDDNRVDINKIKIADNFMPDVSGGYITKSDKIAGVDVSAWRMDGTDFVHEFPKISDITYHQNSYIQSVFLKLSTTAGNASTTTGFPSVIDVPSFLDFTLINELGSNVDAYQFSTYFHKDKNAKLRAGPIWDSNLTYGYDLIHWGYNRSLPYVWQFDNGDNTGPNFWRNLFNNPTYRCYLAKRWNELTQPGKPFSQESLFALIDETAAKLAEASVREHARWDNEVYSWVYVNQGLDASLTGQVNVIKSFITQRLTWMTANLGSFSACSNVVTPPLVITRINYHPSSSSDQEFIEITNTGNVTVDLTGIYFSNTGFTYQFQANAQLPANSSIQLANNSSVFFEQHGYWPFGQFTRNLSNSNQKITLADAMGNVIDEVEYMNQAPWPTVSGNGSYLKLMDVNLDNNVGANWEASSDAINSTVVVVGLEDLLDSQVQIFPNPTKDFVKVTAETKITSLKVVDSKGNKIQSLKPNASETTVDLTSQPAGIFLFTIQVDDKRVIKKVVKQ